MAMIVCPNCGEQVSDRAKKCVHCGEILIPEEKKYCNECGTELEDGMTECPNCGCPMNDTQDVNENPQKVEVTGVGYHWNSDSNIDCRRNNGIWCNAISEAQGSRGIFPEN